MLEVITVTISSSYPSSSVGPGSIMQLGTVLPLCIFCGCSHVRLYLCASASSVKNVAKKRQFHILSGCYENYTTQQMENLHTHTQIFDMQYNFTNIINFNNFYVSHMKLHCKSEQNQYLLTCYRRQYDFLLHQQA